METMLHDEVTDLRETIDSIDAEILKLLVRRRQASQSIQRVKIKAGHPQVDISRERDVIGQYVLVLGPHHGKWLAREILTFCKKENGG